MATLFEGEVYAQARPTYPPSLFQLLASLTPHHNRAWDAGTGSGQAALGLARFYDHVAATDASEQQLRYAARTKPNVAYARTSPELTRGEVEAHVGPAGSVDLVTAAQAVHWFDLPSFYAHVRHVLRRPGGVVAVWCYTIPEIDDAGVSAVLERFYGSTLPYWEPAVGYVNRGYADLAFPFEPVAGKESTGPFRVENGVEGASVEELLGFLRSWSAVKTARAQGLDLLSESVQEEFRRAWGNHLHTISYPIYLRIGTV